LDKIDYEIIRILSKDARTPFQRIAKKLGIGTDTVFRRFKKLQRQGIILRSTVVLSSCAGGYAGLCGVFIKLEGGASISSVRSKLAEIPHVADIVHIWGDYDFYIDLFFRNFEEILTLINSLMKIKEVVAMDPIVYVEQEWSFPENWFFDFDIPILGV